MIGGVNCLRLIHEHTATALAYGIYKSAKGEFSEKVRCSRRRSGERQERGGSPRGETVSTVPFLLPVVADECLLPESDVTPYG